mgnify:CR=1 FL=1
MEKNMDKKEINRINTLIALIVLIMIGIPCVYFLVNRVCYVCTIDNSFQNISKKYEQETRDKMKSITYQNLWHIFKVVKKRISKSL